MKYHELIKSAKPDLKKLPGGWEPGFSPSLSKDTKTIFPSIHAAKAGELPDNVAYVAKSLLTQEDCEKLILFMESSTNFEQVSVQGYKKDSESVKDYKVGSNRTSIWSPGLALQLWEKFKTFVQCRAMSDFSSTDWWQGDRSRKNWRPVGITPLLRFMKYTNGGQHYAHYDAGFIYPDDNYRTLQSIVIYLTSCDNSGRTRFIRDYQENIKVWDRDHNDWSRETKSEVVISSVLPCAGDALIFDHRLCHDVEKYTEDKPRIIIRADLLFEAYEEDK